MHWKALVVGMFALVPISVVAQGVRTTGQLGIYYEDKLKNLGDFTTLDNGLFGDQINLYTGEVQFVQTDVDLRGNDALPMRVTRSFTPGEKLHLGSLGDWDFEIPHITGVYGKSGWVSIAGPRCSVPLSNVMQASAPGEAVLSDGSSPGGVSFPFDPHFYWSGNSLHLPGEGNQRMLVMDAGAKKPTDGLSHHWVTPGRWTFSCLAATANGVQGEGFLAHAPNGDKYWFNWIVGTHQGTMEGWVGNGAFSYVSRMALTKFRALPTRIEDRHGNFMEFTYAAPNVGGLSSMHASDGRTILFRNAGTGIVEVVADDRVWRYEISGQGTARRLTRVTLPDGSNWTLQATTGPVSEISGWRNCADFVPALTTGGVVNITHPSGATGSFQFNYRLHGRTGAQQSCRIYGASFLPVESPVLTALSLDQKVISGPALQERWWRYGYSPLAASVVAGFTSCTTTPCPEVRSTMVSREDGTWDRYTFSQKYGDLEGKLLVEERGAGQSTLRRTDYEYRKVSDGSYGRVGSDPCWVCSKEDDAPKPLALRTIQQEGQSFIYRVDQFDTFARPTRVTKSTSP